MLVATETAFMSTSRTRQACVGYMEPGGHNLLWQLRGTAHSDSGYHHGAPVGLVSQFAAEEEVLFPPCTMLVVLPAAGGGGGNASGEHGPWSRTVREEDGKSMVVVEVEPSFV